MPTTIYGTPRSRTVRCLWMAEELAIPYTHVDVAFGEQGTGSETYRAINPLGQVPSLDDDGFVLTESLAINLYLAKKTGGPLAPRDLAEDAQMTMWTLFGATQIEPPGMTLLLHRFMKPQAERDPKAVAAALDALKRPLAFLDNALGRNGFLVGNRFTAADVNVACCVFYMRLAPEALEPLDTLSMWWAAIKARPAFRKAMALRGE